MLADDLITRATVDADGARWSNHEHQATPSTLPQQSGWATGNAGMVREPLRFARITAGAGRTYAVPSPDHPPAVRQGA